MDTGDHYLLDNNIISILIKGLSRPEWGSKDPQFQNIHSKFKALKESHVFIPVVAIAEIKFGLAVSEYFVARSALSPIVLAERKNLDDFFDKYENHGFDEHSIDSYVQIRARLWKTHANPKTNGRRSYDESLPERLFDHQAGDHLQIDERDLLIFACAVEHNLVFATCDRGIGMRRIIEAAEELRDEGILPDVRVENWNP